MNHLKGKDKDKALVLTPPIEESSHDSRKPKTRAGRNHTNIQISFKNHSFVSSGIFKNFSSLRGKQRVPKKVYQPINLKSSHHRYSKSLASTKRPSNFYTRMKKSAQLSQNKDTLPYEQKNTAKRVESERNSMKMDQFRKILDSSIENLHKGRISPQKSHLSVSRQRSTPMRDSIKEDRYKQPKSNPFLGNDTNKTVIPK